MRTVHKKLTALVFSAALPFGANAYDVIFSQDFDNVVPGDWSVGAAAPAGDSGIEAQKTTGGITESVFADNSTRDYNGVNPFSVTGKNWDIHDRSDNSWVSGGAPYTNPNMAGGVLGHVSHNYNRYEDNFYQVSNVALDNDWENIHLTFDFDSWIEADIDGFGIAVDDGTGFRRIDPAFGLTAANAAGITESDMRYHNLGTIGDSSLNRLLGESTTTGDTVTGFDGHDMPFMEMAGTALFDLSEFAGDTISIRFAFASDSSWSSYWTDNVFNWQRGKVTSAEGVNIDNINLTHDTPDDPPPVDVVEPGSLALAMIGLTAVYRRRRNRV